MAPTGPFCLCDTHRPNRAPTSGPQRARKSRGAASTIGMSPRPRYRSSGAVFVARRDLTIRRGQWGQGWSVGR